MAKVEYGKNYITDGYAAEWITKEESMDNVPGWFMIDLSTGNAVGIIHTLIELLDQFPEFEDAEEITEE